MKSTMNICKWCQSEFSSSRSDALFCSNTCRWKYWKDKKGENGPNSVLKNHENKPRSLIASLQGVITENKDKHLASPETPGLMPFKYPQTDPELKRLEDEHKRLQTELQTFVTQIKRLEQNEAPSFYIFGGITGLGYSVVKGNRFFDHLIYGVAGVCSGILLETLTEDFRKDFKKQRLPELKAYKNRLQEQLTLIESNINKQRLLTSGQTGFSGLSLTSLKTPILTKADTLPDTPESPLELIPPDISEKIISSQELMNMDYQALNFQGPWQHLFGFPSVNFHCVVHGMSGEGKSTFAIQFANYLAENFGIALYVSGEEGFSKTFKDKFLNNNARSPRLFVADLRTYQDIVSEVEDDQFNFIFIDSLDNMKIDADLMKKLRSRYKDSALVTISQSTKDGKMRGSYEIVHDSDMAVKVENGIARTTKNRFKEKGMEVDVFDPIKKIA